MNRRCPQSATWTKISVGEHGTVGPLAMAAMLAAGGLDWVYWGGALFGLFAFVVLAVAMRR